MTYPIPAEAFDDRLAVTGTSGSGKTYSVLGALARLMKDRRRFIAADALGVMYGLRLKADGVTPSDFKPVIFGGPHGDLPLTVAAAPLLGEAAAGMAESVILDLSQLGTKAAERRFMLGFLKALEKNANREPVHLIFDEADLWAPQKIFDKEGEAMKLLGVMDNIVRRGRIKGFIPWLITQRPAVLSKDVLSQADGVVAMKLTGSQDRDAIGAWIEGAADRAKGREILGLMPTLDKGEGVIWIPARQVLKTARFPENATFDSSRTPKRGESVRKVDVRPLDLGKLKDRLAKVEEEVKANDPAALKAQIAQLAGDLARARKVATPATPDAPKDVQAALRDRERAFQAGQREGHAQGWETGWLAGYQVGFKTGFSGAEEGVRWYFKTAAPDPGTPTAPKPPKGAAMPTVIIADAPLKALLARQPARAQVIMPAARDKPDGMNGPQAELLRVLAWWEKMGKPTPTRAQACMVAGWRVTSGHIKNVASSLKTAGLIEYPGEGLLCLTDEGRAIAPEPGDLSIIDGVISVLDGPQRQVFDLLRDHRGGPLTRDEICRGLNWNPTSGHIKNVASAMKTLEVVTYPASGSVALADWIR